jgi:hypothetical protein
MPVNLSNSQAKRWINSGSELSHIIAVHNHYDSKVMND